MAAPGFAAVLDSPPPLNNSSNGLMFDVTATNAITITGLRIRTINNWVNTETYSYRILTKTGSHVGFEQTPGAWSEIGTATVTLPPGQQWPDTVVLPDGLRIPAGQTQALYFTAPSQVNARFNYRSPLPLGDVVVSDPNLQIRVGSAATEFGAPIPGRVYVGSIAYGLGNVPEVTAVDVPLDATYRAGQALRFAVHFDEAVVVAGAPTLMLTLGATPVSAAYVSGNGSDTLVFEYTVAEGDLDADGIAIDALVTAAGTIRDADDNDVILTLDGVGDTNGVRVEAVLPLVEGVAVPAAATYVTDQDLDFTVQWSEAVIVDSSGGTPRIALDIGGATRHAIYVSGSGTTALLFRHRVLAGDLDADGIDVVALQPDGGTLRDVVGNDAVTALNDVGATDGVRIDTVAPTVTSVGVPAAGNYLSGQALDVGIFWSEPVTVTGSPQLALLIGATTRQATFVGGSGTAALQFRYTIASGDNDNDGIVLGALALAGGAIADGAGLDAGLTLQNVGATNAVLVNRSLLITVSAGANGTIAPNTTQTIALGGSATFTATPAPGYVTAWTGTTCPGTASGNGYQVNNLTADCTVSASFTSGAVSSFSAPTATGSGIATATLSGGGATCTFADPLLIPLTGHPRSPPAGTAPDGYAFPHGLFDFRATFCSVGATITLTLTTPTPLRVGTRYWKYGPTPTDVTPHWYLLPATISGNSATFTLTDGGLGDDDLVANGTIVDQGGPGSPVAVASATAIPALDEWMQRLLVLSVLAIAIAAWRSTRAE